MGRPRPYYSLGRLEELLGRSRADIRRLAKISGRFYEPFDIRSKDKDKWRHIDNPKGELKVIQRLIQRNILRNIQFPEGMIGGVKDLSIKDNARIHTGRPAIATIDLRDCFPSTSPEQVFGALRRHLEFGTEAGRLITKLTTFQGRVPQGSPSSPLLVNLVLLDLFEELKVLAAENDCKCSIYVDDITFSGNEPESLLPMAISIIRRHGYSVSNSKVKLFGRRKSHLVTGLTANKKPSTPREWREKLRHEIYLLGTMKEPPSHRVGSAWSSVQYAYSIDPVQGRALFRHARAWLPPPPTGDINRIRKYEIRACASYARHRKKKKGSA